MSSNPRFQTLRVVSALMIREMITRYGRSVGGYIWAVLEPLGMIAILSIAFSQFIRTPALGESFVLFYATGYIPFYMYADVAGNASNAVAFNRSLMQFRMVTPLDAVFARFFLSVLTVIVVSVVLFSGMGAFGIVEVQVALSPLLVAFVAAAALGLGIGTLNAAIFPFFPVWRRIWGIINRPLFLISGVFFTYDSMPANIQSILWWNPLVHVIGEARTAFYTIYQPDYISLAYVYGVAFSTFLIGASLLIRHRSFVIENF